MTNFLIYLQTLVIEFNTWCPLFTAAQPSEAYLVLRIEPGDGSNPA
jgi:hypothetical protein